MVSRAKVAWAYGRMVKHLVWFVRTSPTLETEKKDGLIKAIQEVYLKLEDAVTRERGYVPKLPSDVKKEKEARERTLSRLT